jgi:hypothetical protein
MRRLRTAAATLALVVVGAGCSTMDDVKVSHPCDEELTVTLYHLQAGGTVSDGSPGYLGKGWTEPAPPNDVTRIAGLVNMGADDFVQVIIHGSGWEIDLTRSELRDLDGLITLPSEACP